MKLKGHAKRFYYAHSHVYGWAVYDRERGHTPAYDACSDLLPRVAPDVAESPVLLKSEYAAMSLCRRLNVASQKAV
jgi:hypothetical protein